MSYHSNRKKRAAISAICISIAMLTAQQVPAAALLQEPGLSRDSMAKTPEAVTQQLLAAESSQILQNSTQQLPAAESSQIPQDSTQQLPAAESSGQIPESSTQQPENGDLQQLPAAGDSQENMDIPQEEAGNSTQARIHAKTSSQLPAPKTLQVQALGYNTVTLAWSAVDGAAGYQIEYASDAAHALHRIWQANRMQQMQKAQAGCRMQSLAQMPQTAGQSRSSRSMLWQEAFQKAL